MRRNWLWIFLAFFPLCMMAQGEELHMIKGDCMPGLQADGDTGHARRSLPAPNREWDPARTYHQLVILLTFSDLEFLENHPKAYYESLFNEEGFNEGHGPGCVADYYRTQSNGLFNLQFDVYGPYKVSTKACPYEKPDENTKYYGEDAIREATTLFLADHPEVDFSQYDWDKDGDVDQVICVFAGAGGNLSASYGHIWPNTFYFSSLTTADGKRISDYSASSEYFTTTMPSGIGTICHEFSHCLGLPDLYPVGSNLPYTSVDEWDLMDGGNYINRGWCPPNYSPLEKMLLGWLTPIELTEPATITEMRPISEGGQVYMIKHTDSEFLLLENRQWSGWDAGVPGKGLLIYYVNYSESSWLSNKVNSFSSEDQFRYRIYHADHMNYADWDAYIEQKKFPSSYTHSYMMNKMHLSTSPYPFESNDELTDQSDPATEMSGGTLLSQPITNIQMTPEGLISFDFMGGTTGIRNLRMTDDEESYLYNLQGQRVYTPLPGQIYIVKKKDGTFKKYVKTL